MHNEISSLAHYPVQQVRTSSPCPNIKWGTTVLFVLILTHVVFVQAANGDRWVSPSKTSYPSADGAFKLTVFPNWGNDDIDQTGKVSRGRMTCRGRLERRGFLFFYDTVWERPLSNRVAPVSALVARSGKYVVTFDNWHEMGFGPNTIVIYGPGGKLIRQLALKDFLSEEEIKGLPRSVSSIWWGHGHYLAEEEEVVVLRVVEPRQGDSERNPRMREVRVKLADGKVIQRTN